MRNLTTQPPSTPARRAAIITLATMESAMMLTVAGLATMWAGCDAAPSVTPEAQGQWMVSHASRYLEDAQWRREQLETSLWRPELPYAQIRLNNYALPQGGWDLLPVFEVEVGPVYDGMPAAEDFDGERLNPTQTPDTLEAWQALGEEVFWKMPMRRDGYIEWLITQPELWDEAGLTTDDQGHVRGLVRYRDPAGDVRVGLTCGLCHGANGEPGRANRTLNLGRARELFSIDQGHDPRDYGTWGPGRVDVTNDRVNNPIAIKNLYGAPHLGYLNTSGSILVDSPASLAIRFETQYIEGQAMDARPDRAMMWGLTAYVLSLQAPNQRPDMNSPGAAVFQSRCAGCHDPARGFSGDLVNADALTSNPLASQSPTRGTGFYKTPSLLGVSRSSAYLHDGSQPSLDALLDSGHPFGTPVEGQQRRDLLQFLNTL